MLFETKNGKVIPVKQQEVKLERELQNFFENNMYEITNYKFLKSEFSIDDYRLDSVAYDEENNAFIIVEYKRGKNESLVDQGYAYLNKLLNRKADFVLLYNEVMNQSKLVKDFDWSQTRIVFVSPKFTKNQLDATAFTNMAFELYEVKKYDNGLYFVNPINQKKIHYNEDALKEDNSIVKKVNKEIVVYDEETLFGDSSNLTKDLYHELDELIMQIDSELEHKFNKFYLGYKIDAKHNIVALWPKKDWIEVVLNMKIGELNDQLNLAYDISNRKWPASQYAIHFDENTDVDYVIDLIKQSYRLLKNKY